MSTTARGRAARVGLVRALVVLLASTALGACGSSTGSYCDVLRAVQADWKASGSVLRDPAAAARFADSVAEVEASAPEEVRADWASLHTLLQKFAVADPDLTSLTTQLQGFEASAKRIEVHARETCQVDLTH